MAVPVSQMWAVSSYVLKNRIQGRKHYPLVVMLEVLFRCNFACAGCGKVQYPAHVLKSQLTPEECFHAVEEAGAPIVNIPGGEPLLHPQIGEIVAGLIARGKYVYFCTNALLLKEKMHLFTPSKYLSFTVHLDGEREHHDFRRLPRRNLRHCGRGDEGSHCQGIRVTTNSTLFDGADPASVRRFFDDMMAIGVEGMMLSPGYSYDKAPDQSHFLGQAAHPRAVPADIEQPQEELEIQRHPAVFGIPDGTAQLRMHPVGYSDLHHVWLAETLLPVAGWLRRYLQGADRQTNWDGYGEKSGNPRCANCMVHCGFEPSAVNHTFGSLDGMIATIKGMLSSYDDPEALAALQAPRPANGRCRWCRLRPRLRPRSESEATPQASR